MARDMELVSDTIAMFGQKGGDLTDADANESLNNLLQYISVLSEWSSSIARKTFWERCWLLDLANGVSKVVEVIVPKVTHLSLAPSVACLKESFCFDTETNEWCVL